MISINKIKNEIKSEKYNYLSEEDKTQLEKYKKIASFWEVLSDKDNIGIIGLKENSGISEIVILAAENKYSEERIEIKLLEEIIEYSKNNKKHVILIKIYEDNTELLEILKSCGFIIESNKNKSNILQVNENDQLLLKYKIYEENELTEIIKEYWQRFINNNPEYENKEYEVWNFCYGEYLPNKLLKLVKEGKKTATSSALDIFETAEIDEKILEEGDISIITYGNGLPGCILKTEKIKHKKFREITEEEARLEGEGDLSLKYWQDAHRYFFQLEYEEMGKEFNEDIIVIFEQFKVIYDEDKMK